MLKRQLGAQGHGPVNGGGPGAAGPPDPTPGPGDGDGPAPGDGPVFTSDSGSLSFPPKPTNPPGNDKPPPSSAARPPPPATTSNSPPPAAGTTTSSTSPTPDATTTSSTSSAAPTTIAVPTTSIRSTPLITATGFVATSSFGSVTLPSITTTVDPTSSSSASTTPSATSGVSVGKVVGGIAGGLVGVAIIGFLVSFILRRLRKRNRRNTFNDDDFRQSQFITDNNSDPLSAPNMAQRTHNITPSVGSGPGVAGQGAYHQSNTAAYGGDDAYNAPAPVAAGYGGAGYGAAGYGATGYGTTAAGMGAANAALHERPRYTYGQANDDEGSEIAHGAYSSQPQVQAPYNPEAYGSYAAYAGAPAGYQEATREYQAHPQQGSYAQGGYHDQQQYGGGHYGVAVADPGPAVVSHAGAHSTSPSPRDPGTMNGTRGPNTRSVVQDDDVYGGI